MDEETELATSPPSLLPSPSSLSIPRGLPDEISEILTFSLAFLQLAPPQDFDWNADEDSAAPPPPVPAAEPIASTPSLAAVDKKLEEAPAVAEVRTDSDLDTLTHF